MNSERMPNTPTNTLESIGGVYVTLATTNFATSPFSQKCTKIPPSAHTCTRSCQKPKIHFMSHNVTSISVDENFPNAHKSCQILQNYPWGTSGASGGVWDGVYAPRFRQPTPISFGNFRKSCHAADARTHQNQGTHSLYLALDCKCAFGAKNHWGDKASSCGHNALGFNKKYNATSEIIDLKDEEVPTKYQN